MPLDASDLKILRAISSCSLSEIKRASLEGAAISRFDIFPGDWIEVRAKLKHIHTIYSSNSAPPFVVIESELDHSEELNPDQFMSRLKNWRVIELETQMLSDLENGYIAERPEFEPHDEDWT